VSLWWQKGQRMGSIDPYGKELRVNK